MSITTEPKKTTPRPRRRQLLTPVAYSESAMPSLRLARSSRFARKVGIGLFALLLGSLILVLFASWQQNVRGTGSVIAYDSVEREQTLEAPIKGQIVRWGEDIVENVHVKKGQMIAEIADIDEGYYQRLQNQLQASEAELQAARDSLTASEGNLDAVMNVVEVYQEQVQTYMKVREMEVDGANSAIESAKNKVAAQEADLDAAEAALIQVQADYERKRNLFEGNITSELKFQEVERKLEESKSKVEAARQYVKGAQNDLLEKENKRDAIREKATARIAEAEAKLREARGKVEKAKTEVAKAKQEVNKAQAKLYKSETDLARQSAQTIKAPFDGFLTQITANYKSGMLKQGDPIATIVPDSADRAVQIWLDGNDAPLVEPGRHVRLQFEGWPAVQFAGWPSVAVGTFGGTVASVDATDDGKGKFRILVVPDSTDQPWPSDRFLRQGVRANGWVLLNRVPLWFEIWRNMNGFPPVVNPDEPKGSGSAKVPKIPKV